MADPFLVNPNSLAQMDNVPVRGYLDAMNWQKNAEGVDAMTLAEMPAQRAMAKQKAEADLAAILSQNRHRDTQTTGLGIANQGAERDLQVRQGIPIPEEVRAKLSKMAAEISDNDLKATMAEAQLMAASPSPQIRARGEQILGASQEMFKIKQTQAHAKELADANNRASLQRTMIQASATENAAAARKGSTPAGLQGLLAAAKGDPKKIEALLRQEIARTEAVEPDNTVYLQELRARLQAQLTQNTRLEENQTNRGGWYRDPQGKWKQWQYTTGATPPPGLVQPGPDGGPPAAVQPAANNPAVLQQISGAQQWLAANPNDPRAAQVRAKMLLLQKQLTGAN